MAQDLLDTRDHDLLVRLDTKLDGLSASFAEVRVAVALKADSTRVDKIEAQVTSIDRKIYTGIGALAALQACIHLFWK